MRRPASSICRSSSSEPKEAEDERERSTRAEHAHCHGVSSPGGEDYAEIDIFRLDEREVVEHWDVLQTVPAESANDNSMFSSVLVRREAAPARTGRAAGRGRRGSPARRAARTRSRARCRGRSSRPRPRVRSSPGTRPTTGRKSKHEPEDPGPAVVDAQRAADVLLDEPLERILDVVASATSSAVNSRVERHVSEAPRDDPAVVALVPVVEAVPTVVRRSRTARSSTGSVAIT